jgi:hypothetical protein
LNHLGVRDTHVGVLTLWEFRLLAFMRPGVSGSLNEKEVDIAMRKAVLLAMALSAAAAIGSPGVAVAQEPTAAELEEMIELARVDLKKQRVRVVGDAMEFAGDEAAAFWPIYKEYEAEFTKQGDARLALIEDYAEHASAMTNEKANELAKRALDLEAERTALKRKYFEKIAKALSPIVAARFIQVENQLEALIDLQIAAQVPLVEKPQQ